MGRSSGGSSVSGPARIAVMIGSAAVLTACGGVSGSPAAEPAKPFSPAQIQHIAIQDTLRSVDPCGLLDQNALADAGEVLQYGSAVQPSVCSALIRDGGGAEIAVDVSLLPSMLSDRALSNPAEVSGVTVFRGDGPDLERGTCERVFPLNLGDPSHPSGPHYATVRTGGAAGADTCPLAGAVVTEAVSSMESGLPGRVDGAAWAVDAVRDDPCELLDSFPSAARVVDASLPPTPFECTFFPDGVESRGNEVTVTLGVKAVESRESDEANEPEMIADRCRSAFPVGPEIDVTRPDVEIGEFARALGHARGVVTVHGSDCGIVGKVANAALSAFG